MPAFVWKGTWEHLQWHNVGVKGWISCWFQKARSEWCRDCEAADVFGMCRFLQWLLDRGFSCRQQGLFARFPDGHSPLQPLVSAAVFLPSDFQKMCKGCNHKRELLHHFQYFPELTELFSPSDHLILLWLSICMLTSNYYLSLTCNLLTDFLSPVVLFDLFCIFWWWSET